MSDLVWYERYEEEGERAAKVRKPRNAAFLNDDSPAGKFFKRKKKRVVKKDKKF